jgi:hypothetical protein
VVAVVGVVTAILAVADVDTAAPVVAADYDTAEAAAGNHMLLDLLVVVAWNYSA